MTAAAEAGLCAALAAGEQHQVVLLTLRATRQECDEARRANAQVRQELEGR